MKERNRVRERQTGRERKGMKERVRLYNSAAV